MDARGAIENLVHLYAERMDAGDFAGVAALFAEADYVAGDGPPIRSAEVVERILRELVIVHADGTPRTKHVTSNLIVEINGSERTATARSVFTVLQGITGQPIRPIVMGRYQDRFANGDGGWRFRERRIHVDATGDLSQHLRNVPGALRD